MNSVVPSVCAGVDTIWFYERGYNFLVGLEPIIIKLLAAGDICLRRDCLSIFCGFEEADTGSTTLPYPETAIRASYVLGLLRNFRGIRYPSVSSRRSNTQNIYFLCIVLLNNKLLPRFSLCWVKISICATIDGPDL